MLLLFGIPVYVWMTWRGRTEPEPEIEDETLWKDEIAHARRERSLR
jgi:hypothetical protein